MNRRIKGTTLGMSVGREPPREFQLWAVGENPTDYGVHVWNERSVREVVAQYNQRGNPLLLDVEHNGSQLVDGTPAPTAGYARLEVRHGAPWLVFDWSEYGREQIATGQRRFVSPEYDVDKSTGEILALYRVSLVANPGTHRARMLASAIHQERPMELSVILAALRAALAAEDPAVAKESISNLLVELEKGMGGDASSVASEKPADDVAAESATPGEDEDMKDKKVAAAAAPKPAPKLALDSSPTSKVTAAADSAVRIIQNATRDHLLETQGARLEPSIRRWASAQPLEVVRGLLDATPAKETAKARATATRGAGKSELSERELALCAEKKIDPAKYAETRARIAARSQGV